MRRKEMAMAYARAVSNYTLSSRPGLGRELECGLVAGQVAGLAMAAVLMGLFAAFLGESPFRPLHVIGESFSGDAAGRLTGPASAVLGILIHQLGPSLFWGAVFGLLVWVYRPRRGGALLMLGILVGALAEVIDVDVILPALSQTHASVLGTISLHVTDSWSERVPVLVSWLAHLAFGVGLSVYPWRYDPLARTFD
jgi:hypothetical protein